MTAATVLPLSGLTIVPGDYEDEQILIQVDFCFSSPHPFLSPPKYCFIISELRTNSTKNPWCVSQTTQKMKLSKEPLTANTLDCCDVN